MSPSLQALLQLEGLRRWLEQHLLLTLGWDPRMLLLGVIRGTFDMLLILLLGSGMLQGGRAYMAGQYALPRSVQTTVLEWAPVADQIARKADIPREVPLVLWFKENSMRAQNPESCTGIIGAYDLVRSGDRPCFTPGPISDIEVGQQLAIAALEFKKRCPDVSYLTHDPEHLKRCYLAYNAGAGAAERVDPDTSAYVMNNYDESYQNMVYRDVELGTVRVTALGAWPAHLAMQSLIVSQLDQEERPFSLTLLDISNRVHDRIYGWLNESNWIEAGGETAVALPARRTVGEEPCLGQPHLLGHPSLRPRLNPVSDGARLTQDVHGCSYNLPGMDISSDTSTAILQAPMPGDVTTFTDRWYNSTIRIENEEWIVWLLHPRSYLVKEGQVDRGDSIGIMGAVGNATGPHVHYTIYDKINETFVDPGLFLPTK